MAVMSLSSLPLGFRFRPTDEELIDYYLRLKINGNDKDVRVIREIDVCKVEPWDLPDLSIIPTTDSEWFFFCPRDRKYPNGNRLNRATAAGYWKATGKDRNIKSGTSLIGMKKTLVFYTGRAPKGKRTNWVMHEYRPTLKEMDGTNPGQSAYVLCRLFKKQDDSIEDSNGDELEPAVSSPNMAKSLPEDTESDVALNQVSPALREDAENLLPSTDLVEHTNKTSPGAVASTECDGNITNAYYDAVEADPLPYFFNEPTSDPVFSPLHSQMQAEFGSSGFYHPETNDFSNSITGAHIQGGTNESDDYISDFLDSVLNSDEYPQEENYTQKSSIIGGSGIWSSSGVQAQFEQEFQGIENHARNESWAPASTGDQDAVSGIVRRARGIPIPSHTKSDATQGSAPRRIRLDTKYQAQAPDRVTLTVKLLRLVGILVLLVMCISLWRYLEF